MDSLTNALARSGYLPHGYCFTWDPGLLWTMVGSDLVIAMSYFSIPAALLVLIRKRGDFPLNGVVALFSAFIFACGGTHVMDVWTIWNPDYALQSVTKVATATISLVTAVALWPLIPKALAIPSVRMLQDLVQKLESEVEVRRVAERDLLQVRSSLQMALGALGAGLVSANKDGQIVQMNSAAEKMTGWLFEQARGLQIQDVLRREGVASAEAAGSVFDFIRGRNVPLDSAYSVRIHARDGRLLPIVATTSILKDPAGEIQGLAVMFQDRSEVLQSEADNSRLAALVEGSADAIIGTSLDGTILTWNRGAETMLGHEAGDAIGREYAALLRRPGSYSSFDVTTQVLRGDHPKPVESEVFAKDGSLRCVSELTSPVEDGQGGVVGVSHILRDVSAQRRSEHMRLERERLVAENMRILEASRLKNAFVANMSHELRTPLNAIIGFSDLLSMEDDSLSGAQRHQFLGYINSSGKHLLHLINDVLDLSKVESGTFEYFPEPVNLVGLSQDTVAVLKPAAEAQSVQIDIDVDPSLTDVEADPARLKQVLYNYLSNAIKFSREGGHVSVRMRPEGSSRFRIEVQDRGIGISQRGLSSLFVEFQQLDTGPTKRYQGTGLGLALTRKLVESQGGEVGARSEVDQGSVFHAVLPRKGREVRAQAGETVPGVFADFGVPQLLVVDEDDSERSYISGQASVAGFGVIAANEDDALALAGSRMFDAVALSVLVKNSIGPRLLDTIRVTSEDDPVTVVVLPTSPPTAFRVHDILPKPLDHEHLREVLDRLCILGRQGARLLVVDDDPKSLALMALLLQRMGVQADFVEGAAHALELARESMPDGIILDLMMPGMDGFDFLGALRRIPDANSIPVVVWTSMTLSSADRARLVHEPPASGDTRPSDGNDLLLVLQEAATITARRKRVTQ